MKLEILKMAFESLLANKTRTILSMLGIVIGVSTVIAVFAIGQGAQKAVDEQFQGLSANSILIMSNRGKESTGSSKLKTSDGKIILEKAKYISKATAIIFSNASASFGKETGSFAVMGIDENYFSMSNLEIEKGRFFTQEDVKNTEKFVILGSDIVEKLFIDTENTIGQTITVAGKKLSVIGTAKETGKSMGRMSVDEAIFIPQTTALKNIIGKNSFVMINTTASDVDNIKLATEELTTILREEHKLRDGQEDDFRIMDAGSMVGAAQEAAKLMTFVLTAVAAIVLLVSGIGIMNVMFVTVAERTKEIGIAKAIGGKQADILSQFLMESIILSMMGGMIGVLIGLSLIPLVSKFNLITITFTWIGSLIGFSFSVLVGIFFGFYPALKASRLDPVDALRSE